VQTRAWHSGAGFLFGEYAMSIKLMSKIFEADPVQFDSTQKLILLAMTDYASDDGTHIYPSIATLCKKTSLSERCLQKRIKEFRASGVLVMVRKQTAHRPREYRIAVHLIRPAPAAGVHDETHRGEPQSPESEPDAPNTSVEPSVEPTPTDTPQPTSPQPPKPAPQGNANPPTPPANPDQGSMDCNDKFDAKVYGRIWGEHQGLMPYGKWSAKLKELQGLYGVEPLKAAWEVYARTQNPDYNPNVYRFAEHINQYLPKQPAQGGSNNWN